MINEGLLYYGKFNETPRDYSGKMYDPIPSDDLISVSDKNGLLDNAYQFGSSGTTTIKQLNINSNTLDLNADFTYSCWINTTSASDSKWILSLENRGTPNFNGAWLQLEGTLLYARRNGSTGTQDTTTNISINTWYHIVYRFIKSTNTTELWINNSLIGSKSGENIITLDSSRYLTIGNLITDNKQFIGYIDEVRVYNRAITNDEITLLYNQYDFQPILSNLVPQNNSGDIKINVTAQHGLYKQDFTLEYSLNGIDWNNATLKYNPCIISNDDGNINTILWDSASDFTTNENSVQIRIQSNDTIYDSNTLTSSTFTVNNQPILPVEPTLSDLASSGTSGDIEVSVNVFDDFSITTGEVEYRDISLSWQPCTLKYNTGKYFKASDIGTENTVLWDSKSDFSTNLNTKLRMRVVDSDELWSDWIESSEFTVNNFYSAPVITSLSINQNYGNIDISFDLTDDKYTELETEIQYYNPTDLNWYSCTIKYGNGLYSKADSVGLTNNFLWDSITDFGLNEVENVKLRIRVKDEEWSSWEETSSFTIDNTNPDVEVFVKEDIYGTLSEEIISGVLDEES